MSNYKVVRCCDEYYQRAIYGIGCVICDYPDQVVHSCIVQGWCPVRCTAQSKSLDVRSTRRSREHTLALIEAFGDDANGKVLKENFGVVPGLIPFTNDFPRADIYELISPDLLHQIIKGTFKDHLVTWICKYLELLHGKTGSTRYLADIDRRIAAVPHFARLRHFHQGRGFKQWTGDDSKALMKVASSFVFIVGAGRSNFALHQGVPSSDPWTCSRSDGAHYAAFP